MENIFHCGDSLPILKEHIKSESVDLIYLDPVLQPLNSAGGRNIEVKLSESPMAQQ
jgi:hypothetical protein